MTWRLALAVVFLVGVGTTSRYRVRAHIAGGREPLNRREEGLPLLILIRLCGLILFGTLAVWFARPEKLAWAEFLAPDAVRALGLMLIGAAFAWIAWVFHTLGANLTDTVVTRRNHTLVTDGPYRWMRHPFYLALPVAGLGATLAAALWIPLPLSVLAFVLLALRARKEEENLVARFGSAYRRYASVTGRFFPRWRTGPAA
jgi:protein-S-isoprenylcysteine O-methyltransferase Ste14